MVKIQVKPALKKAGEQDIRKVIFCDHKNRIIFTCSAKGVIYPAVLFLFMILRNTRLYFAGINLVVYFIEKQR